MLSNSLSLVSRLLALCLLVVTGTAWATSPTKPPSGPDYSVVTYYHNDLAGSPLAATDSSGYVLWREEYSPYGERVLRDPLAGGNHLWFTGHPHDEDSGLTYAGARHYDPMIGRFMSVDPVGVDAANSFTFNRYAYGNNNPHSYEDPDGREPGDIAFGITIGLFMKAEDARKIQRAEVDIGNSHVAASIDTGLALRSAQEAASQGATGREILDAATAAYSGIPAREMQIADDKDFDDIGSSTAGKAVDSKTRERILARDRKPDGSWVCATCGQSTNNPDNIHTGHIKARSKGGDLSDANLRCEGAACNLSQGNRATPKPSRTCKARGSCGAPYGRSD